jgi:uncharacterized protein (DUF427 family)
MIRAVWQGHVIAESDATIVIEGNHYFPPESVDDGALLDSATRTRCFWKGRAEYRNLLIDGDIHRDMAWTYPQPWPLARRIEGYVAFSPGVVIERW